MPWRAAGAGRGSRSAASRTPVRGPCPRAPASGRRADGPPAPPRQGVPAAAGRALAAQRVLHRPAALANIDARRHGPRLISRFARRQHAPSRESPARQGAAAFARQGPRRLPIHRKREICVSWPQDSTGEDWGKAMASIGPRTDFQRAGQPRAQHPPVAQDRMGQDRTRARDGEGALHRLHLHPGGDHADLHADRPAVFGNPLFGRAGLLTSLVMAIASYICR